MLDMETRKAIHAIREELGQLSLRQEMQEIAFMKHNAECHANKEGINEILSAVRDIRGTMRFANGGRKVFLWFAGIVVPVMAIWQWFKGGGS